MARDVNYYESILLDKMVDIRNSSPSDAANRQILLLLDCICDFREPPRALDVDEGYGALVDNNGEVIA